jgi:hypothetical protein
VTRTASGDYRYVVEERVLIDVLGVHKEEISKRAEYTVTPDYRPVSLSSEGKQSSGASRARGAVRDG